jgi:glycosyltransferase involved in cell wall biosynthesis
MGQAGRERAVERFAWSAVAERVAALYETLL